MQNFSLNCHGWAQCGSCRVHIKSGQENVNKPGLIERLRLRLGVLAFARIGHEDELRLSCQTRVHGDIEVETQPQMNLHGEEFWK